MKAEQVTITEEMAGNKVLAEALMSNFTALNEMAEKRELLILERIGTVQKNIIDLRTDVALISQNMNKLMQHFNIAPDKVLLKG